MRNWLKLRGWALSIGARILAAVGIIYAVEIQRGIGASVVVGTVQTAEDTILVWKQIDPTKEPLTQLEFGTADVNAFGLFKAVSVIPIWVENGGDVTFDLGVDATDVRINGVAVGNVLALDFVRIFRAVPEPTATPASPFGSASPANQTSGLGVNVPSAVIAGTSDSPTGVEPTPTFTVVPPTPTPTPIPPLRRIATIDPGEIVEFAVSLRFLRSPGDLGLESDDRVTFTALFRADGPATRATPTPAPRPTATPPPGDRFVDPFEFAKEFGDERPRRGGTMKVAIPANYPHFDFHSPDVPNVIMQSPLYNGLLMTNPYDWRAGPVADLAYAWEMSDDGKMMTFHLHDDVEWHDGVPFTSADAKWSYERILFNGAVGGNTDTSGANFHGNTMWPVIFDSFETPDRNTFVINLVAPSSIALKLVHNGYAKIVPRHIGQNDPIGAYRVPTALIGTGSMRVVGEVSTTLAIQERNPNYFKPHLPWVDGYEAHTILDQVTRATAVLTQRVFMDGINSLPYQLFETARSIAAQDSGVLSIPIQGLMPLQMYLNASRPPMDDIRIRQAMSEAIDRSQLMAEDVFTGVVGLGTMRGVISTVFPAFSPWYPPDEIRETFIGYGPDMEVRRQHARDLIADYEAENGPADWSQGPGSDCFSNHVSCDVAILIQADLRRVGIDFPIRPGEITEQFGKLIDGDTDTTQLFTVPEFDDPSAILGMSQITGAPLGFSQKPSPARLDELSEKQLYLPDGERLQIAWEMDRIAQEDASMPVLFFGVAEHLQRDFVKGFSLNPGYYDSIPAFEYLWLDLPGLPFADDS